MREQAPTTRTPSLEHRAGLEHLTSAEQAVYAALYPKYRAAAVNPLAFTAYDQKQVQADLQWVRSARRQNAAEDAKDPDAQETRRRGELAEALVYHGIEENGWLGPDAQAIVTAPFDDIVNGVDMVTEFIDTEGYRLLALSVDATFSQTELKSKIRGIAKRINRGELSKIKYFQPDELKITGGMDQVPLAAVFLPPRVIKHVCELEHQRLRLTEVMAGGTATDTHRRTLMEVKAALGSHPVRRLLHQQLTLQLKAFAEYARRNPDREAIADALDTAAARVAQEAQTSAWDPLPEEYKLAIEQMAKALDDILA